MSYTVILDFDGVLALSLPDMLAYGAQACAELGHACTPTRADLDALERMEFEEYGRQLGLPEGSLAAFTARCLELFAARTEPPPPAPGMAEAVRQLASGGAVGIVTGNGEAVVRSFLRRHGLEDSVGALRTIEQAGSRAEKIGALAAELGDGPGPLYMVGDAVSDMRAGRQAGAITVAVAWGHQSAARLKAAGADHCVSTPAELVALVHGRPPAPQHPAR